MLSLGTKKGGKGEGLGFDHSNDFRSQFSISSGMKTNLKCNLGQVYTRQSNQFKGAASDRVAYVCLIYLDVSPEIMWGSSPPKSHPISQGASGWCIGHWFLYD